MRIILKIQSANWKFWNGEYWITGVIHKNTFGFIYFNKGELVKKSGTPLQWCHNNHHDISNHWHLECLLSHMFSRASKKTSKHCVTGLCEGNRGSDRWIPLTKGKMFPLDDVIMTLPGRHCLGNYPGILSCGHVSATHLKIRNPFIFIA